MAEREARLAARLERALVADRPAEAELGPLVELAGDLDRVLRQPPLDPLVRARILAQAHRLHQGTAARRRRGIERRGRWALGGAMMTVGAAVGIGVVHHQRVGRRAR